MAEKAVRQQSGAGQHVRHAHFHHAVGTPAAAGLALAHQRRRTGDHGIVEKSRPIGGGAAAGDEDLAGLEHAAVGAEPGDRHVERIGHLDDTVEQTRQPPARRQSLGGHHRTTPPPALEVKSALGAYAQRVARGGSGPKSAWRLMTDGSSGGTPRTRIARVMISAYTGAAT